MHPYAGRNEEGPLSPKSAERRASLVEEMRAEFARGDQEQLAEWDGGEDRQAVGRKRGRGSVAKEGQVHACVCSCACVWFTCALQDRLNV